MCYSFAFLPSYLLFPVFNCSHLGLATDILNLVYDISAPFASPVMITMKVLYTHSHAIHETYRTGGFVHVGRSTEACRETILLCSRMSATREQTQHFIGLAIASPTSAVAP